MSDVYSRTTVGGRSGDFVYDDLEQQQFDDNSRRPEGTSNPLPEQEYEEVEDHEGNVYSIPKAIEYPEDQEAPYISFDQYEDEDREKFKKANNVVKGTDTFALELLGQINTLKQEIADTMGDLFNNINTLTPYPTPDQRLLAPIPNPNYDPSDSGVIRGSGGTETPEPPYIIPTIVDVGTKISYITGITTFIYPPSCVISEAEQFDVDGNVLNPERDTCISDVNCCLVGMKAPIYPDVMETYIYPVLEDEDIDEDFYTRGAKIIELKDTKIGMGKTSFTYGDADGFTGFKDTVISYNSPLGYYYLWENLQSFDQTVYNEITSKIDNIELIRQNLVDFISNNDTGSNNLRDIRHDYQINLWYGLLSRNAKNRGVDYDKALETLEDNDIRQAVQEYDG